MCTTAQVSERIGDTGCAQISQNCDLGRATVVAVCKCVHLPPLHPSGNPWILISLFKLHCLAYQGKVAVELSTRSILMLTPQ